MARTSIKVTGLVISLVLLMTVSVWADEWKEQGGHWYCYDADGNMYRGVQRRSGANYYYLDEESGAMVTEKVVEINGAKYYFGADGARIAAQWQKVFVENEDDGFEYMYFGSGGKAVTGGLFQRRADGEVKRYQFDDNGYMLYGYLTDSFDKVDYPSAATYYYGTKEEGFRYTGWVNITDGSDEMDSQAESLWFYFGTSGKKIEGKSQYRVASGNRYTFEAETGKMVTGWAENTTNEAPVNTTSALNYRYYGKLNDGAMQKDKWVSTQAFNEEHDSRYYWYYLNKSGEVVNGTEVAGTDYAAYDNHSEIAKISNKYYCFDLNGRMQTGFVLGHTDNVKDPTKFFVDEELTETATGSASAFKAMKSYASDGTRRYYIRLFSEETEDEGAMKTQPVTVTLEGSEFEVYLDKYGIAYEGVIDKKIYNNGIMQTAGSYLAAVYVCNAPSEINGVSYEQGKEFLINKSGTILFSTKIKNSDNRYFVATANACGPDDTYMIYRMADKDYASQFADYMKKVKLSDWEVNQGKILPKYTYVLKNTVTVAGREYKLYGRPYTTAKGVWDVYWIAQDSDS